MKRICSTVLLLAFLCIAHAQVGVYRSSGFGSIKKEKKPLPTAMIGLTGGIGLTACPYIIYPNGAVSFDFAISATPKFALGMFTQWGILENWSFGLQFVHGDFINRKTAVVWGVGMGINDRQDTRGNPTLTKFSRNGVDITRKIVFNEFSNPCMGAALRLGYVTPKHFYMLFDAGIWPHLYEHIGERYAIGGDTWEGAAAKNVTAATITVSFGYAFGITPKNKKQQNLEQQ